MAACLEPDDPGGGGSDSQALHLSTQPKAPWGPARPKRVLVVQPTVALPQ